MTFLNIINFRVIAFGWLFLTLLYGCKPKELSPAAYCKWVENPSNELRQVKSMNGYELTFQYKPAAYIALKNSPSITSKKLLDIEKAKYEGLIHFNLKIQSLKHNDIFKNEMLSEEQSLELVNYFSYPVQNHIKLLLAKDTLPCALYHFERSHYMAPYCNMVLGFNGSVKHLQENMTFLYHDRALGIGNIQFSISPQSILDIPEVEF